MDPADKDAEWDKICVGQGKIHSKVYSSDQQTEEPRDHPDTFLSCREINSCTSVSHNQRELPQKHSASPPNYKEKRNVVNVFDSRQSVTFVAFKKLAHME